MDSITEQVEPTVMRAKARVGRTLRGKWHLDVLLGVGGMAAVYAATHRNGTRAAIKILHPELGLHSHIRGRFFREGRAANVIHHDGAVKVLDEDEAEDGSLFLVMELLDGESLDGRARRLGGKLACDEVLCVADQLLDVLAAAHAKGVIHRDLKPENVFLTRAGEIKVLDFGIARLRELSTQSQATQDGATMGTPAFMPPEQARGLWDEVDGRADLWAVGATMFALLTGRAVHQGRTTNELLVAAVTRPAPPLLTVAPEVPPSVANVIDRALAFDKADRWPTACEMQDGVRHAYHELRGASLVGGPRPTVPATVPNRTLADSEPSGLGAPKSDDTESAVMSGRTGVPLGGGRASRRRVAIVAGAAGVLALVLVAVLLSAYSAHTGATNAPPSSLSSVGAPPEVRGASASMTAEAELVPPGAAPEAANDAASAVGQQPAARPVGTPSKKLGPPMVPGADAAASQQPATTDDSDWKDKRR